MTLDKNLQRNERARAGIAKPVGACPPPPTPISRKTYRKE